MSTFEAFPERGQHPSLPAAVVGDVKMSGRSVVCSYWRSHVTCPCPPVLSHYSRLSRQSYRDDSCLILTIILDKKVTQLSLYISYNKMHGL